MANSNCGTGSGLYQGTAIVRNPCEGKDEWIKFCCLDRFEVNKTQEVLYDKKSGAQQCSAGRVVEDKITLDFDVIEKIFSAETLNLLMGGSVTQHDENISENEILSFPSGSWCASELDSEFYTIPYNNADGSIPTIVVTGSVDGVLVDGTDYQIIQKDNCGGFKENFLVNMLEILPHGNFANTLTTEEQDITVDVTYTPNTNNSVSFTPGAREDYPFEVIINGVNKSDPTNHMTIKAQVYLTYSGPLITYDDGRSEPEAKNFSLEHVPETEITIDGIDLGNKCYDNCA